MMLRATELEGNFYCYFGINSPQNYGSVDEIICEPIFVNGNILLTCLIIMIDESG